MPYLNWKEREIGQRIAEQGEGRSLLSLTLRAAELGELRAALEDVFARLGTELRVDLPQGWVLFWKRREGESRLLIAHPQEKEWVATLALVEDHGKRLLERMSGLSGEKPGAAGPAIRLGELATPGAASNLELELRC